MHARARLTHMTSRTRVVARLILAGAMLLTSAAITPGTAAAVTLTPAPPAGATCRDAGPGTICSWIEHFGTPFPVPYGVACVGFSVKVDLSGERRITAFYDASGTLDRRIRHGTFSGTLSNGATGATVPHEGHFTIVDDFSARTSTITGMLSRTVLPKEGVIWRNIGRIVLSIPEGNVLFEAGEHGTWAVIDDPAFAAKLCSALD